MEPDLAARRSLLLLFEAQANPFWAMSLGNWVEMGTLLVLTATYLVNRTTENRERRTGMEAASKERQETRDVQVRMHAENGERLRNLMTFHEAQLVVNAKRDEQIAQLTALAAASAEMMRGLDRRMQLMEDQRAGRRRG